MEAKALLKSIFSTDSPEAASTGATGATEVQAPPQKTRKEGDYLPIIAIATGIALLSWSVLGSKNRQSGPPPRRERLDQDEWEGEETYSDD